MSGRSLAIVQTLRNQLGARAPGDPALETLERLERAVALLEQVAADSFGDFEHRTRDLSMLRRMAEVITSTFALEPLCQAAIDVVRDEIACDSCALTLAVHGSLESELRITRGDWDETVTRLAECAAQRALETLRTTRIDDAIADRGAKQLALEANRRAILVLPIAPLGRPLGSLTLLDSRAENFDDEQQRAVELVSELLGIAIRHAHINAVLEEPGSRALLGGTSLPVVHVDRLAVVRQERSAVLTKLAANVAHEVNNPMSYVLSGLGRAQEYVAELETQLEKEPDGSPASRTALPLLGDFHSLLDEMADGLGRIRRVARELHTVGRTPSGDPAPEDLNAIIESAVRMARGDVGSRIRISTHLKPLPPVSCRRIQITQLVGHLLQNAIEASEPGGVVRVTTYAKADRACVEVADTGPGVPPERRERIFEPFYSTKRDGNAGLGLSIARDIATLHEGSLRAGGVGAGVFTLELPVTP